MLLEDNNNVLLKRREIKSIIKNAVGSVRKDEAANMIAEKMHITRKNLIPISLSSEYGNPDVLALMYYYDEVVSIGDSITDISMFNKTKYSITFESSTEEVRNNASHIVKGENGEGLINAIDWVFEQKSNSELA